MKSIPRHKVFISYHHKNDQKYKNQLQRFGEQNNVFVDRSIKMGKIPDHLSDKQTAKRIRDKYLRDSTVTILLAGTNTKYRKHVDWELHSSMYDSGIYNKSGILVITLPEINDFNVLAAHSEEEKKIIHPEIKSWAKIGPKDFSYLPDRILDNLNREDVSISVLPWEKATHSPEKLKYLIHLTFLNRKQCNYDYSCPMLDR